MSDTETVQLISLIEDYTDVMVVSPAKSVERTEWLKERKKGIGGSDAGAIAGVDPYTTPLDVYLDKIGERGETPENPHIKRGRRLEALIAQEYMERHPEVTLTEPKLRRHPDHQWMIGTPDRIIASPQKSKMGLGILEIKAPARAMYERIKLNGVPPNYILQMQHYLMLYGYAWGTFAIFNADQWEMLLVDVERDDELCAQLLKVEERFWNENVVPRVPPPTITEPAVKLPKHDGKVKDKAKDPAFGVAVEAYLSAQDMVKEAESLQTAAKQKLIDEVHGEAGVYETLTHRVYYTAVDGRTTFDKKALAQVKPIDRLKLTLEMQAIYAAGQGFNEAWADLGEAIHLGKCDLDLSEFETKGSDFMTLRVYPAKREK